MRARQRKLLSNAAPWRFPKTSNRRCLTYLTITLDPASVTAAQALLTQWAAIAAAPADTRAQLNRMEALLASLATATTAIQTGETKIMASIDDLTTAVAAETTLEGSIITLLDGVQAQLVAAGLDATKVNAVFDKVTANNTALQAAITANTPVAPAPPAPPAAPGS